MQTSSQNFAAQPAFEAPAFSSKRSFKKSNDPFYQPTRAGFLMLYKSFLIKDSLWHNHDMLERFMARVEETLVSRSRVTWQFDSFAAFSAYRQITGYAGKITLAHFRELPVGPATTKHSIVLNHSRWPDLHDFTEWLTDHGQNIRTIFRTSTPDTVDGMAAKIFGDAAQQRAEGTLSKLFRHYQLDTGKLGVFRQ